MEEDYFDPAYVAFSSHIEALTRIEDSFYFDTENELSLELDEITVEMPIELDVKVDENNTVYLGSSPPVYYANTSVQPVFHNLKIRITEENNLLNGGTK